MIERLIAYCARNQFLVFLLVAFVIGWGVWAILHVPLDAIPDLSDVQVIILTKWPGRSPDLVEDQITYPVVTSLLGAPRVKVVRGQLAGWPVLVLGHQSCCQRGSMSEPVSRMATRISPP